MEDLYAVYTTETNDGRTAVGVVQIFEVQSSSTVATLLPSGAEYRETVALSDPTTSSGLEGLLDAGSSLSQALGLGFVIFLVPTATVFGIKLILRLLRTRQ